MYWIWLVHDTTDQLLYIKKSNMADRSNMAAILPINDVPKRRFTIIGFFLYEKY